MLTKPLLYFVVAAILALAPAALHGAIYTQVLQSDAGFYDFFYGGRDYGWDASSHSVSYYYDCCPAYRSHHYAFLRFNLPTLSPGETVTSAKLYMFAVSSGEFGGGRGTAVLNDGGSMTGGTGDLMGAGTALFDLYPTFGWNGVDVSSTLAMHYALGYKSSAFILKPAGSGIGSSYLSLGPAGTSGATYLEITTTGGNVPEPATVSLAAGALVLFGLLRIRRARAS